MVATAVARPVARKSAQSVVSGDDDVRFTGWADYSDTQYDNNPDVFSVTANTDTVLPNNAGTTREQQLPPDLTSMYNSSTGKILGKNGDAYNILVEFDAETSTSTGAYLELWFDIGGSVGELYRGVMTTFSKGNNTTVGCIRSIGVYTLDTWETNGASVNVRSNQAVDIYNIRYVIQREHKAR